jgi:Staphylococcal nuclease homologue
MSSTATRSSSQTARACVSSRSIRPRSTSRRSATARSRRRSRSVFSVAITVVRLYREPKTDAVDAYGRLLRYVFRARDGLNVNVQLVRVGAAAPYFYDYRRGRYAALLVHLALRARARHVGLWGRCPGTPWDRTMASPRARRRRGYRLCMQVDARTELVIAVEIAKRLSISPQRVDVLASGPGFPKPLGKLGRSAVWRWSSIER